MAEATSTTGKVIAVSTLMALVSAAIYAPRVLSAYNAGNKAVIVPNIGIDANAQGLVITANPIIKNPTSAIYEIDHPFAKVSLNNKEKTLVGSSSPVNKKYTVVANGESGIDQIRIMIQWVKVPALIAAAKTGTLDLFVEIGTGAHLEWIPFRIPINTSAVEKINTTPILDILALLGI